MATEEEIVQSFARLADVWGVTRKGLVVSINGARVGTWSWNKQRMVINAEDDEFGKVVRRLQKDGIIHRVPGEVRPSDDAEETTGTSILEVLPLTKATPGLLDSALKQEGYLVIDLNLPLLNEEE